MKINVLFLLINTLLWGHSWDQNVSWNEDIKEHKKEFLKWRTGQGIWEEHERVTLALSCHDADAIFKHPDAGRVFDKEPIPYQLMHNGIKVIKDGYCGEWTTDLIYGLKGHHEPQEEKVFHEVLKHIPSKGVMIELGSYWGYYSLWFAKQVAESTNYLIEPHPARADIGKRNFALNNLSAFMIQGYVGTCDPSDVDCRGVRQIFIDDFLEENKIEHVNILHSDIQGAEYEMLQSAINSIASNKIDYFFISTHSEEIHARCIHFLESNHYIIIAEHSPKESYSCDGLVVGKHKTVSGPQVVQISKRR